MTSFCTRASRLARYVEDLAPLPECLPEGEPDAVVGRYLLVQRATGDGGSCWFTVCPDLDGVRAYWRQELDPADWLLVAIIDLDDGSELPFAVQLVLPASPAGRADGAGFTYADAGARPPRSAAWPRGIILEGPPRAIT